MLSGLGRFFGYKRRPLIYAMTKATRKLFLPAVLLALLVLSAPASAASWQTILQDCILHDGLQGNYKRADLQNAKQHATGERLAYTECVAEISAAMNSAPSPGAGPSGGGGGDASADINGDGVVSPEEKRAAKRKKARETREIAAVDDVLKDDSIGTIGGDDSSSGGNLGMILAILALALLAIGGGTWYAARRNPAIANALRRVPLPGRRG